MASIIDERMYRLNEAMVMAASVTTGRTKARGSVKMAQADAVDRRGHREPVEVEGEADDEQGAEEEGGMA